MATATVTAAGPGPSVGRGSHWSHLPTKAKGGVFILAIFVVVAVIAPWVAPYDPSAINPAASQSLHAPDVAHWLGTTQSGQDVLSQFLVGIRMTMELAVIVGAISTGLSALVGVSAGYLGGIWDEVLSFVSNIFLVLPALPLMVVLLSYSNQQGQWVTIFVLSVLSWPWGARVIRAQTLTLRRNDYVAAAREIGERAWRVVLFEILPNEVTLIAATFVGVTLYAIGTSVALAFLGLASLSSWSLGTMLYWAQSQDALQAGAWWWFLPPGLAVAIIGTALVLLNFGLDEYGNPRLRDSGKSGRTGRRKSRPLDPTPVLKIGVRTDEGGPVALARDAPPASISMGARPQ